MDVLPHSDSMSQPHGNVLDETNGTAANGSSYINPAIAACYTLPVNNWVLLLSHIAFMYSCLAIHYGWRPLYPFSYVRYSKHGIPVFAFSALFLVASAYINLALTSCEEVWVLYTMAFHYFVVPFVVLVSTFCRLLVYVVDDSLSPSPDLEAREDGFQYSRWDSIGISACAATLQLFFAGRESLPSLHDGIDYNTPLHAYIGLGVASTIFVAGYIAMKRNG